MTYPILKDDPALLKIAAKDDEIKEIKYKTEKQDYEDVLEILKDYYDKNFSKINKKKLYITIPEILVRVSQLAIVTSLSITGVGTSSGVPIAVCTSFLASVATENTNEYFSRLKLKYTKLKVWINMITILYEKT